MVTPAARGAMLSRSNPTPREEGRLLQSWAAQTLAEVLPLTFCGARAPSCVRERRVSTTMLLPVSRTVPSEPQLLPGLVLGTHTGSAQGTWARRGAMMEKCIHENFSDALSFHS